MKVFSNLKNKLNNANANNSKDSNNQDISPIKRWQKEKKLIMTKMWITLLLTNIFNFLLFHPQQMEVKTFTPITLQKDNSILMLKANLLVSRAKHKKKKVSLVDSNGKLIAQAFLWPYKDKNTEAIDEDKHMVKLELKSINLKKISKLELSDISIFPRIKRTKKITKNKRIKSIKKEFSHEIIF